MYRRWKIAALVALVAAALAGCRTGGSTDVTTTQSPPVSPGADTLIRTVMTEFAYDPDIWFVDEREEVEVVIDNQGTVEHNWAVLSSPISSEGEFDDSLVLYLLAADPGAVVRGRLTDLPAGEYQVICTLPGHFDAGQFGELRVVASG